MANLIIPTKTVNDKFNLTDFQSDFNELASRISSNAASYTAADVLNKLKTVDADDAGINATTLQSHSASDFVLKAQEMSSLAQNGYKKFQDGLIIQWGDSGIQNHRTGTMIDNGVTFPIQFPTACLSIVGSVELVPEEVGKTDFVCIERENITNTYFFYRTMQNDYNFGGSFKWIAIGF